MAQFSQGFTLSAQNPVNHPIAPSAVRYISSGATSLTIEFEYNADPTGLTFTPGLFFGNNQSMFYAGTETAVFFGGATWRFSMTNLLQDTEYAIAMFAVNPITGEQAFGPFSEINLWVGNYGGTLGQPSVVFGGPFQSNTVNYIITGDGFTAGDQTIFNNAVNQAITAFTNEAAYWNYLPSFNVIKLPAFSNVSGIPTNSPANNFYGTFGTYTFTGSKIMQKVMAAVPGSHVVICLMNANIALGLTTTSLSPNICTVGTIQMIDTTSRYLPILMHELGHGFGRVGDEYGGSPNFTGPEPVDFANITINTDRTTLKWGGFVQPSTPIPTVTNPNCAIPVPVTPSLPNVTGLFETGNGFNCGMYHPTAYCYMNGSGSPYCQVCEQEIVNRFKSILGINEPQTLRVTNLVSVSSGGGTINMRWNTSAAQVYDQFKVFFATYIAVDSYWHIYTNSSAFSLGSNTWQIAISGLVAGTRYQIAVEGHTSLGWSRVTYASNQGFVA